MNLKIAKKTIAISLIFIFILSLSNPVFADLIQSNEDGVAYDLFEDDAFIDEKNDCIVENGTVTLESRPFYSIQYDYDKTPDNIEAWEHDDPFFVPGGDIAKILSTITSPNLFAKYEFENIATIGKGKDYYQTESIAIVSINYVYHPLHLFKIKIDEKVDQLLKFEVGWRTHLFDTEAEYENTNLEEIRMYLWSYGDLLPRWNFIDKINYTKDEIESADGYIYTEESANKFISNEGIVHILIVGKPIANIDPIAPAILTTDYVVLEIPVEEGYKTNGNIISKEFKPDTNKFYGWDKIIWESSIPTENTYVKIQVLNANKEVIPNEELEGNEDGFLSSPVDISSLDTSFSSIRLKALFHTKIYKNTPLLFSWGVLWHSTGGFFDSFKSDYKISESLGINIKDGDVTISEFYSEWPIFGKNPANTRSYTAPDYTYNITETYWRTDINRNIGGWFRSPIMSDGKIYIAGNDSKIYSFNLSRDGNWESYESILG